jgi:hypothetical protein
VCVFVWRECVRVGRGERKVPHARGEQDMRSAPFSSTAGAATRPIAAHEVRDASLSWSGAMSLVRSGMEGGAGARAFFFFCSSAARPARPNLAVKQKPKILTLTLPLSLPHAEPPPPAASAASTAAPSTCAAAAAATPNQSNARRAGSAAPGAASSDHAVRAGHEPTAGQDVRGAGEPPSSASPPLPAGWCSR